MTVKFDIGILGQAILETLERRTALACLCFSAVYAFLPACVVCADAPEEKVWSDAPEKSEPSKMGPLNEAIDLNRYHHVRHVSQQADTAEGGDGSAGKPCKSIKDALGQIKDAGPANRYAVLVSKGTYGGETILMKEYVDLYGGFDAGNWRRDVFANRSILDGRQTRRVVEAADNARLDGFLITGGTSTGHGAGILCHRTSPDITNNVVTGNATLEPTGFVHDPARRRHVGNDGGGIACVDGAHPLIANNIIFANSTETGNGAAIACRDDSCPKIIYNVIWANATGLKDTHDTRSSNGGGISCFAGARPVINNNLIANNSAGGGSDGGAVYCEYNCSPQVRFNFVLGNRSDDDGGAFEIMKSSQPRIHSNFIAGNRTGGGGGGIRLSDQGLARIQNNVITRNKASGKGGGIACTNAWMVLNKNTIVNNASKRVGGVIYYNEDWPHLMPPTITNNIICGNTDKQLDVGATDVRIESNKMEREGLDKADAGAQPRFTDDRVEGIASSLSCDSKRFVTVLSVSSEQPDMGELAGQVVRVGKKWSVVRSNTSRELVVWGKLDDQKPDFEVLIR